MSKSAISSPFRIILSAACLSAALAHSAVAAAADNPIAVIIDGAQKSRPVSRYEYGMFIEPIGQLVARTLWSEMLDDGDQKIALPRQVYLGERTRAYIPMAARDGKAEAATVREAA